MSVKSILITKRARESDDLDIYYEIGKRGVTKIEDISTSPEPYCVIKRYAVFVGEEIIAEVREPDLVEFTKP